ncbi:cytochrome c (plasmid) [Marivivens sp. LCG002]|uniref:c-type cytochrome n=1 Tax=Marivivens sp. LCG002 TaxID=3051171 RepID=UPI00255656C6|nr:cytochrome c [Marivivens sp. LCG002]WIV52343.1 cytochrome c [Marivivens sp. LCG002]
MFIAGICGATLAGPAFADHEFADADLDAGKQLYADNCAACHGLSLEGQPHWKSAGPDGILPAPPHNESGHTWHHDTGLLVEYTRLGGRGALAARGIPDFNSGMPAFVKVLTERQILEILAYIRSSWSKDARAFQASRTHEKE